MQTLPWIVALAALVVLGFGLAGWLTASRNRSKPAVPLPVEWSLTSRPVFTKDERRVYRLLREALPQQLLLAKLPLVRFCQPSEGGDTRYWYELLGSLHVGFAICTASGRVIAAIDLESDHPLSRRALQIKQSVLGACSIRYLRAPIDQLPSIAELQALMPTPSAPAAPRAAAPASPAQVLDQARDSLANTVATRRAERHSMWHDSGVFQDSFFAPDSRHDTTMSGAELGGGALPAGLQDDDIAGVVVDAPRASGNGHG
ncbi:MAG: DUF2726 domain-containing protein [Proteobacteria bacterium]|nr:DUF2726 domain-containing protein [Pseudomonadota bacterium]